MGQLFSKYKTYILVALGILVALALWWSLAEDTAQPLLETQSVTEAGPADKSLVDTLLQLRAVSLGGSIFTDPAFMSLRDFGTQIIPEPVGRPNPFAPIQFHPTSTAGKSTPFSPRP